MPLRTRARRRAVAALLLLAGAAPLACGGDSAGPEAAPIEGSYRLNTINGQSLPFTYASCGFDACQITGGRIVVRSRGRLFDIKERQISGAAGITPQPSDTQVVAFTVSGGRVLLHRTQPVSTDNYVDTLRVEPSNHAIVTLRARVLFRNFPVGPYVLTYVKD